MVTAQVSLYPLRQSSIGPVIRETVQILEQHGLHVRMGEMSTLAWGDEDRVFSALQEAFRRAAEHGDTVMTATLSNACPTPS